VETQMACDGFDKVATTGEMFNSDRHTFSSMLLQASRSDAR